VKRKDFRIGQNTLYRLIGTLALLPRDKIKINTIHALIEMYLNEFSRLDQMGKKQNEAKG